MQAIVPQTSSCAGSQYVNWCNGGSKDAFFTNDGCHQLFKNHIRHFVNRYLQRLILASVDVSRKVSKLALLKACFGWQRRHMSFLKCMILSCNLNPQFHAQCIDVLLQHRLT